MPESGPPGGRRTSIWMRSAIFGVVSMVDSVGSVGGLTKDGLVSDHVFLGIERATEPSEDLAPLGEVPVAKARTDHIAAGRPGAAADHLAAVAEEDLGVFGVGERLEAGIGDELRARPLPDVAEH